MTGGLGRLTFLETDALPEVVEVRLVLGLLLFVLALPVLIVVGIALGPAALVLLFVIACGAPILLVSGANLWHKRDQ
jgi:hypothetical protein